METLEQEVTFYTDGGAHNLGDGEYAKAGIAVYSPPTSLGIGRGFFVGDGVSSNMAESEAIIATLKYAIHNGHTNIRIISDSQLTVRHIEKACLNRRGYECSDPKLMKRLAIIKELIKELDFFDITHMKRDNNKEADALVRSATAKGVKITLPSEWKDGDITTYWDDSEFHSA
ncbi:MAG: ribonuclease HI family protein [Candidatus Izemoplasmatales bacterium]|jgi:ribonuclease HI